MKITDIVSVNLATLIILGSCIQEFDRLTTLVLKDVLAAVSIIPCETST